MVGTGTKSEIRNCHRLLEKQAIKHELTRKHVLCYGRRMHTAVGRIMSPTITKDGPVLMPRTCMLLCMAEGELRLQVKLRLLIS